jgi:crotonobetainyl-CoA:carnitine CoA-transferase CaiB-like acyl-CoA transferase
MTGVLDGLSVLDLSWGVSGPMVAMLLGDHGARVTRIEAPDGDPFGELSGHRTWNRNKRRAVLDLHDEVDRDRLIRLAAHADVLVESFSPGITAALGIDFDALRAINPRLVYCSISAYGQSGRHADRPGIDALVAARTGHDFEGRGTIGGTIGRLSGTEGILPGLDAPEGCMVGPERDGPLFSGPPWISLAAAYLASLGINAALRVREQTGRGQWVQTSLLQGALGTTIAGWQRAERSDARDYVSWVIDPRAPKGFYRGSDGRWMHHWTPLPAFVLGAAAGDQLRADGASAPKDAPMRIGVGGDDMIVLQHYHPILAEHFAKFPSADWIRVAAEVGVPLQPVRSPEEALLDPAFLADGCVVEVDDAEHGRIRQVGRVYSLSACPTTPPTPVVERGAHTAEVIAEADALGAPSATEPSPGPAPAHPLAGVKVLDLGLAVAGPWGTQQLAELGAEVIKVNTAYDGYWMSSHIAMTCNRSKRSISINLKDPQGKALLDRLVAEADVVQHNMRYDAAIRLGVDDASLRAINPSLIYCHTRGFECGERDGHPGNDQTGAALAGTSWLDGGLDDGGNPLWSVTSLGDTGNGFLAAIGIVQALYHRDRTGEGQFVDTSIVYAQLLNASSAWVTPDGTVQGPRHALDREQAGVSALYRLYRAADERWVALGAFTWEHFVAVCAAVGRPDLADAEHFAPAGNRSSHDADLTAALAAAFAERPARAWFDLLDTAGVPVEIADPDFVMSLFDDPEMIENGWVTHYEHPVVGRMDAFGSLIDFSETPGKVWGGPLIPGQDTREILGELGYDADAIDKLIAAEVVFQSATKTAYG